MDNVELAQEGLERAAERAEERERKTLSWNKHAAIVVAVLAAFAVIVEMSANDAQTAYLSHHVSAADIWGEYQAKSTRRVVLAETAAVLDSLGSGNPDPAVRARAERALAEAARMASDPQKGTGMQQLSAKAAREEHVRDEELERHEKLERGARGLQIGVVVTGLAIATGATWLFGAGGLLGAVAAGYALLSMAGVI